MELPGWKAVQAQYLEGLKLADGERHLPSSGNWYLVRREVAEKIFGPAPPSVQEIPFQLADHQLVRCNSPLPTQTRVNIRK